MLIPQRILVLGSGGSGKTTFSRKLAAATRLPVFHLDSLYWNAGWKAPQKAEWEDTIAGLVEQEEWIVDGSYGGTLDLRLPRAEMIVYLDISNWRCVRNILMRRWKYAAFRGKTRPGMAEGCPESISFSFLKWVLFYPWRNKPGVFRAIEQRKSAEAQVVVFKSYKEMDAFLNTIVPAREDNREDSRHLNLPKAAQSL